MRILIAEDDAISRMLLTDSLTRWGYDVVSVEDGEKAWEIFQRDDAPFLAILDWMMPDMDGVEVCRRVRELARGSHFYIILLTSRDAKGDIVGGLSMGANDYVVKPFDPSELRARIGVGERMIQLQEELAARVADLQAALDRVNKLQGMLPICAYCKKIRADQDYWQEVEAYVSDHSAAEFSHGICPECFERLMGRPINQTHANFIESR